MHALDALRAREQFGIKLGLEPMRLLCAALGHPERRYTVVHVAGTNGKGSVTAMTAQGLTAAGHRTGRYTSPHLVDLVERFAIDGTPVDHDTLAGAVGRVLVAEDRLGEDGAITAPMTFFELCTAAAFLVFAEAGCTVAVIEVGLGGRFDATNIVIPALTAITNIAIDHTAHLGTTLEAIAYEKAGIIKPGVPVVLGAMPDEARATITAVAHAASSLVVAAAARVHAHVEGHDEAGRTVARIESRAADYGRLVLGLRGAHQVANAAVAVSLLESLRARGVPVPAAAIVSGVVDVRWPGRLDLFALPDGTEVLLDAAHNADGARALARYLDAIGWTGVTFLVGVMRDKDAGEMIDALAARATSFVVTQASTTRARPASELAAMVAARAPVPTRSVEDVTRALDAACAGHARVVVCGSIYLLGDVEPLLKRRGAQRR